MYRILLSHTVYLAFLWLICREWIKALKTDVHDLGTVARTIHLARQLVLMLSRRRKNLLAHSKLGCVLMLHN